LAIDRKRLQSDYLRMRFGRALALLAVGVLVSQGSPNAVASAPVTRSCGTLSLGIGWHLRASANVGCPAARVLMTSYFRRRGNRYAHIALSGYSCAKRDLASGEQIRCVQAAKLITALSFGY
jgi:hypothetical protein